MAWTAPRTWVTGETPTAAIFNTHVRDNFLEFDSATAGSILASDGTAPVWRNPTSDYTNTSTFSFTNSSYLALDSVTGGTPGTACAVTVTTGTEALVLWRARHWSSAAGGIVYVSYSVSGASSIAASDVTALAVESGASLDVAQCGIMDYRTGLTAGSNTFELEARVSAGTAEMVYTEITVIPF